MLFVLFTGAPREKPEEEPRRSGVLFSLEKGQKQTKRLKCISFWTSIEVSLALAVEGVRLSYDHKRVLEQGVVSFLVEFYFLAFMYS